MEDQNTTDEYDEPVRKRKRILNQLRSGIGDLPSHKIRDVYPAEGQMIFKCFNKSRKQIFNISFSAEDNKFKFECDCTFEFEGKNTSHCVHLNSAIIQLCKNFIDVSADFSEQREQYIEAKKKIFDLGSLMDKLYV